jgi:hypothetical protein
MRTIAVMEGFNEKSFNSYLSYLLDLLDIEHNFQSVKGMKTIESDYAILNSSKKDVKELSVKSGYCFANMDNRFKGNINIYGSVITYGFGAKNTVTVSSLKDDNEGFVYCLQRYLSFKAHGDLEPQEIPISLKFENDGELYAAMIAITITLLEGSSGRDIEKRLSKKNLVLI